MLNYSNSGIYFESNGVFQKGAKIFICIQNSPYKHSSGILKYLQGKVIWRKELSESISKYGYGIKLVSCISKQEFEHSDASKEKDLRRHPRKPYFRNVRFSSHNRIHDGRTQNISASGVSIATEDKLEVGQVIGLTLPHKDGKTSEIIGRIVWVNKEGFGLKFQKVK
jgi:Tfp pilus assembly protein PilZ